MTNSTDSIGAEHRYSFRQTISETDIQTVRDLTRRAMVFSEAETEIAVELASDCLARGPVSGYHFIFIECGDSVIGYACYGPVPATMSSFDLYWIVVDREYQGRGIGTRLLEAVKNAVRIQGGRRLYAETSGRADYRLTRTFYELQGFRREAELTDFYSDGDDKIFYTLTLSEA